MTVTRRSLLKGALGSSLWPAFDPSLRLPVEASSQPPLSYSARTVPGDCGVASGEPLPDSVVLWTRVPEHAHPEDGNSPLWVSYEMSLRPDFNTHSIVARGVAVTSAEKDFTVKVEVTGLPSETVLYYRFRSSDGRYRSIIGRTRTAPPSDSSPRAVRFAFVSCQNYTHGHYAAYASLLHEDVDFCVHLGDNIYEGGGVVRAFPERADTIGDGRARSLDEYRAKYKLYLSDPWLRAVRAWFPWIVLWDDHEVRNNYAGTAGDLDTLASMSAGHTAFLEYQPVPLSLVGPRPQMYRSLSFGGLLEAIVLDQRQYRDSNPCPRVTLTRGCSEISNRQRTLLGAPQKAWLKEKLRTSEAQWKVIFNEVMLMPFRLLSRQPAGPGVVSVPAFEVPRDASGFIGQIFSEPADQGGFMVNLDSWDGYPAERAELLDSIASDDVRNVIFCTGDIHNFYAGELSAEPLRDPGSPRRTVATEFITASVTSVGFTELVGGPLTHVLKPLLHRGNPHLRYADLRYHGYSCVTLTRDFARVRFYAVPSLFEPVQPAFLLKEFTLNSGSARLT